MFDLIYGVYYILARPWGSWSTIGTYYVDLAVEVVAAPNGEPDAFESDNSIEEVTTSQTHLLTSDAVQTHSIHQTGDIDYARIELSGASDIKIDVATESNGIVLRLYDVDGTEMSNTEDVEASNTLSYQNLPAGNYFVSVANTATPQFIAAYELALTVYAHPSVPTNLVATPGAGTIVLRWDAVTPSTGYLVQYSYSAEGPFESIEANDSW